MKNKRREEKIRFGLPVGSLNSERWSTEQLLLDAGYQIVGYEPNVDSSRNLAQNMILIFQRLLFAAFLHPMLLKD